MKIHSIYDAGDSGDRFTVYFKGRGSIYLDHRGNQLRQCLCMSGLPFYPQGVCQHGYGIPGRHNGRKIQFTDLPEDCQRAVMQDLE